jgi:hypothetical protein
MGIGCRKLQAVGKMAFERHIIPLGYFFRVQVKDDRQGIEFVEAGRDVPIFDVSKTAQVNYKIGTSTLASQFITGPFNVPIRQTETFTGVPKTRAWVHF